MEVNMINKYELIEQLAEAVVQMEEDDVDRICHDYINSGNDVYDAIRDGLAQGMDRAGKLYEEEEYYIPELLICSDAMYRGLDIFAPHLKKDDSKECLKAVVGVVQGDTHDIGKNLFKIMLETVGFEVMDLGRDVPPADFIKKAIEIDACLVGMSTLMTTTMNNMDTVIRLLEDEGIREKVVVMVGGGPISQNFADRIGADGYAPEASKAAKLALEIVQRKLGKGIETNQAVS